MGQRNGVRSSAGRSAIARRTINSGAGSVNGIMSPNGYNGGPMKGGAQPSATGFMIPSGRRHLHLLTFQMPNILRLSEN